MPNNNRIRLSIDSIKAIEGQGVGEGKLEMRVQATEGSHTAVWPDSQYGHPVVVGGPACMIDRDIAFYTIAAGSLTKNVNISVTEVDSAFNGGDDTGSGAATIVMKPGMTPVTQTVVIPLRRPGMNYLGKVSVTLKAQVA